MRGFEGILLAVMMVCSSIALGSSGASRIKVLSVAPTVDTAAYADDDQMGTLKEVPLLCGNDGCAVELQSVLVVDKGSIKADFDIIFFDQDVTEAADNAALSVSDAEMLAAYLGRVSVLEADFVTYAANSVGQKLVSIPLKATAGKRSVWMLLHCTDTAGCDYVAAGDLAFRLGVVE